MARFRDWALECKVYVGNLLPNTSEREVEQEFSKHGPLKNVWVARKPPGFAFVEFEDSRDAEDAVRNLDGARACGTKLRVEMSTGRSRRNGDRRRDRDPAPRRRRTRSRSRSPRSPRRRRRSYSMSRSRSPSYSDYRRSRSISPP